MLLNVCPPDDGLPILALSPVCLPSGRCPNPADVLIVEVLDGEYHHGFEALVISASVILFPFLVARNWSQNQADSSGQCRGLAALFLSLCYTVDQGRGMQSDAPQQ